MNLIKLLGLNFFGVMFISCLNLFSMSRYVHDNVIDLSPYNIITMQWGNRANFLAIAASRKESVKHCSGFGIVRVWDGVLGKFLVMDKGIKSCAELKWSLDDKILFAVGVDFIRAWNVSTGKIIYDICDDIISVGLCKKYMALVLVGRPIFIIDIGNGWLFRQLNLQANSIKINFGDFIVFNSDESLVSIYSYEEHKSRIFCIENGLLYSTIEQCDKTEENLWAFPNIHEIKDCFCKDGIASYDKKLRAFVLRHIPLQKTSKIVIVDESKYTMQ